MLWLKEEEFMSGRQDTRFSSTEIKHQHIITNSPPMVLYGSRAEAYMKIYDRVQ